jgi:putative transposon-encoded protein
MRTVEVVEGKLALSDEIDLIYEKTVTSFGTSGKIDCPKKYIGRRVYVMIIKDDTEHGSPAQ